MGYDSLLMPVREICWRWVHRQRGVGSVGRLLILAYMGGCLTICQTCLPCPPSGCVNHCFLCPLMNGLIALFCLLTFFWCGEYGFSTVGVGVTLRKGCGIQGRNFLELF